MSSKIPQATWHQTRLLIWKPWVSLVMSSMSTSRCKPWDNWTTILGVNDFLPPFLEPSMVPWAQCLMSTIPKCHKQHYKKEVPTTHQPPSFTGMELLCTTRLFSTHSTHLNRNPTLFPTSFGCSHSSWLHPREKHESKGIRNNDLYLVLPGVF